MAYAKSFLVFEPAEPFTHEGCIPERHVHAAAEPLKRDGAERSVVVLDFGVEPIPKRLNQALNEVEARA